MGYEEDFTRFLTDIQSDVERKIFRGHDRLKMNKQREMVVTAAFSYVFLCFVLLKQLNDDTFVQVNVVIKKRTEMHY